MRIQYMSDLHLELWDNSRYLRANEFEVVGDVLVLAGDTFYLRDTVAPQKKFWNWASKNFRQVLLVPGNHEFYSNSDVTARGDSWQWMFRENVGYYYNKVVRIDDTDFILTTLWSKIPEPDMYFVQRGMNDFRQIMYDGRRFTPDDFNLEHEKCLKFLKQSLEESSAKHIVVVTHHLPTLKVVAAQHMGSVLNGAFATELGNYIADSRIDVWIYGHSHTNIDTTIGNTRIVCNQLGYIYYNELRPFLAKQEVFNVKNQAARLSFDDLITWKRDFSSLIYKESNVYNRDIEDYIANSRDQRIESERITDKLRQFENDLWEF